jgi:hypothetical protein
MERVEPHMRDLLLQGSIVRKFARRAGSPWVLQFRLYYTGTRSGRQKRLYVGPKWLADMVMEEIWRRREEKGTQRGSWQRRRGAERNVLTRVIMQALKGGRVGELMEGMP